MQSNGIVVGVIINYKILRTGSVGINPIGAVWAMLVMQGLFRQKKATVTLVEATPEHIWGDAACLEESKGLIERRASQRWDMLIIHVDVCCFGQYPETCSFTVYAITCNYKLVKHRMTQLNDKFKETYLEGL
jgi:hypothetical protein